MSAKFCLTVLHCCTFEELNEVPACSSLHVITTADTHRFSLALIIVHGQNPVPIKCVLYDASNQ